MLLLRTPEELQDQLGSALQKVNSCIVAFLLNKLENTFTERLTSLHRKGQNVLYFLTPI